MRCPRCGSYQLIVANSRPSDDQVRRRRECLDCKKRFSTLEVSLTEYTDLKQQAAELVTLCKEFEERAAWLRIKYDK